MGRIRMHGQGLDFSFLPPARSSLTETGSHEGGGHFVFRDLCRFPGLIQRVFSRHGGVSRAPYESLNTSYSVGDLEADVSRNLSLIRRNAGAGKLVFMNQAHGGTICTVRAGDDASRAEPPEADAMITSVPGTAIMAKLADCQGIILYDPRMAVAAVVHCGWRGQVIDLAGLVVARMTEEYGCDPGDINAAVSPSLGPCCAEFIGYEEIFPGYFKEFYVGGDHFDLWELSRFQLERAGVPAGNISVAGLCTKCRIDLFFSYRAEKTTGRFCVLAMLL